MVGYVVDHVEERHTVRTLLFVRVCKVIYLNCYEKQIMVVQMILLHCLVDRLEDRHEVLFKEKTDLHDKHIEVRVYVLQFVSR